MSGKLLKSGMIVSFMTLISRVLGLVRDVIVANVLGAGAMADVFFMANRIPNFLRRLFAEGAFSQAFVPVLAEVKEKHGDDAVRPAFTGAQAHHHVMRDDFVGGRRVQAVGTRQIQHRVAAPRCRGRAGG